METFIGSFEHALDSKGRLILPASFRPAFEMGGYLSQNLDGCLALWTPEEFRVQIAAMGERAGESPQGRNMVRIWAANSAPIEVDRQGRMAIPARLRTFASLEAEVLVHGALDRIEIWAPVAWEQRVQPAESLLFEGGLV